MPLRALLKRNEGLGPAAIEEVFFDCANQAGGDNSNVARMSLLLTDLSL
jgi:3-oxoadipyl-CoA thiolase